MDLLLQADLFVVGAVAVPWVIQHHVVKRRLVGVAMLFWLAWVVTTGVYYNLVETAYCL